MILRRAPVRSNKLRASGEVAWSVQQKLGKTVKQPGFWRSVSYAWEGLVYTVQTQRNARIHLVVGSLVFVVAGWLNLDTVRWGVLVLTIGGVLAAETINTTVEAIVDLLSPDWHAQAKVAKDVAAAGVLILSLTAIVIGLLILGPPLYHELLELWGKR